jgi:outer membrane protein W
MADHAPIKRTSSPPGSRIRQMRLPWIESDVEINNAIDAKVDVDPWIFGVGVGYKF